MILNNAWKHQQKLYWRRIITFIHNFPSCLRRGMKVTSFTSINFDSFRRFSSTIFQRFFSMQMTSFTNWCTANDFGYKPQHMQYSCNIEQSQENFIFFDFAVYWLISFFTKSFGKLILDFLIISIFSCFAFKKHDTHRTFP